MKISRDNKNFLELIGRSTPVIDGWCKVSSCLTVYAQNNALDNADLVEFVLTRNRLAYIRLTEKGKKRIKRVDDRV